jgi:hypothetical protein
MDTDVPEWMLVSFLIFSLNEVYSMLITVLENSQTDELTFDATVAVLLKESRYKNLYEDLVAMITKTRLTKGATCDHCYRTDYTKEQCGVLYPELHYRTMNNRPPRRQRQQQSNNKSNKIESFISTIQYTNHFI